MWAVCRVRSWGGSRLRSWRINGVVGVDGRAHFAAPGIRAEGVDIFVLGELDRMIESLAKVGEGGGR